MRKILIIILLFSMVSALSAQNKRQSTKQRKAQTVRKVTTTQKNTAKKKKQTVSIKGLQQQRKQIQKKIKQQEEALRRNEADVKMRLQDLEAINTKIGQSQQKIEVIKQDIDGLNSNIDVLKSQLVTLEEQLADRQRKYVQGLRYLARHRSVQDKLMFIFSAKNFAQMYRRLRFVRQYAQYQRQQGEMVKAKQREVDAKQQQILRVKGHKNVLLNKGVQQKQELQTQQTEQEKMVASLKNQQKTIQSVIAQQKKKDADLNAQIDRLVALEVARAKARAEAEAKRKAEAEAAKKRREELERKKAEAAARERENQRRIAEAKAREAQLKEAARKAQEADAKRKAELEQQAKEAEAQRQAAERKAEADEERNKKDIAKAQARVNDATRYSASDRMMNGGFEANRGRLPMPITGAYQVVSRFGLHKVEGLNNVQLDNKGIKIKGSSGCQARAVYDGEVTSVFSFGGMHGVMVRHGIYISVYFNLSSVAVQNGQKVSTRQILGTVGTDNILQFQLRKETATLNPEVWLGR